jgi:hypothetical protein
MTSKLYVGQVQTNGALSLVSNEFDWWIACAVIDRLQLTPDALRATRGSRNLPNA